jgi:hypothetical protein
MHNRPRHAGYLFVDHRSSPGIPDMPGYGEGQVFEADTQHCSHCNVPVVLVGSAERVAMRRKERFICPRCDWYCCDICAIAYRENMICKPFEWVAEEIQSGKLPVPIFARDAHKGSILLP